MTNVIVVADEIYRPFWGSPLYEIIISFITLGIPSVTAYYALYTKRLWTETKTAIEAACWIKLAPHGRLGFDYFFPIQMQSY